MSDWTHGAMLSLPPSLPLYFDSIGIITLHACARGKVIGHVSLLWLCCLSVCLSVCLSACLSVCLSAQKTPVLQIQIILLVKNRFFLLDALYKHLKSCVLSWHHGHTYIDHIPDTYPRVNVQCEMTYPNGSTYTVAWHTAAGYVLTLVMVPIQLTSLQYTESFVYSFFSFLISLGINYGSLQNTNASIWQTHMVAPMMSPLEELYCTCVCPTYINGEKAISDHSFVHSLR